MQFTTQVKKAINNLASFPLVDVELRVDGTGYAVIKYAARQYYQPIFTREQMKQSPETLAKFIVEGIKKAGKIQP